MSALGFADDDRMASSLEVGSIREELANVLDERRGMDPQATGRGSTGTTASFGSPLPGALALERLGVALERVLTGDEEFRPVYEAFPKLMLKVFGFGDGLGWLEAACYVEAKEREAFLRILSPNGPIHRIASAIGGEYTFELPLSNLPMVTQRATDALVADGGSSQVADAAHTRGGLGNDRASMGPGDAKLKESMKSLLAEFCASRLSSSGRWLTVSCHEYFLLCMLSSPLWCTRVRMGTASSAAAEARRKRSSKVPSRRAVYNELYRLYLNFFLPVGNEENAIENRSFRPNISGLGGELDDQQQSAPPPAYGELFVRASVEFFAESAAIAGAGSEPSVFDIPPIGALDALTLLVAHVRYSSAQEFQSTPTPTRFSADKFSARRDPECTNAMHKTAARAMVVRALRHLITCAVPKWPSTASAAALLALLCAFALHIAPWSARLTLATEERLLPKRKRRRSSANASTLHRLPSALEQHLPSLPHMHLPSLPDMHLPTSLSLPTSATSFRGWETYVTTYLQEELAVMLPMFLIKAAKLRLGASDDGARLLMTISEAFSSTLASEAATAARSAFSSSVTPPMGTVDASMRELASQIASTTWKYGMVAAIGSQMATTTADLRGLSAATGVQGGFDAPSSGFHPLQNELHPSRGFAGLARERLRKGLEPDVEVVSTMRRQVASGQRMFSNRDVGFLGGPWDLPPYSYECASLLPVLHLLSTKLTAQLGMDVNLRFLASYYTLLLVLLIFLALLAFLR